MIMQKTFIKRIILSVFFTLLFILATFSVIWVNVTHQIPQIEDISGEMILNRTGFSSFHSGEFSASLVSLSNSSGLANPGVEVYNQGNSTVGDWISSLYVSSNVSGPMKIDVENESTLKIENHSSGNSIYTDSGTGILPFTKIIAGFTEGSVSVYCIGGYGINGSIGYDRNLNSTLGVPPPTDVESSFPVNVTVDGGNIESTLNLQSSEFNYLAIYFPPGNYQASLNEGLTSVQVADRLVMIYGFNNAEIGLTLMRSKFVLPYDLISSIELSPYTSEYDYFNGTFVTGAVSSLSGQVHQLSGNISLLASSPVDISVIPVTEHISNEVKFFVSANFAQVYSYDKAVFTILAYKNDVGDVGRIIVGTIAGAIYGSVTGILLERFVRKRKQDS